MKSHNLTLTEALDMALNSSLSRLLVTFATTHSSDASQQTWRSRWWEWWWWRRCMTWLNRQKHRHRAAKHFTQVLQKVAAYPPETIIYLQTIKRLTLESVTDFIKVIGGKIGWYNFTAIAISFCDLNHSVVLKKPNVTKLRWSQLNTMNTK